jgi:hypothetical protein
MMLAYARLFDRLKRILALLTTLPGIDPVVPPDPTWSTPAVMVVLPE